MRRLARWAVFVFLALAAGRAGAAPRLVVGAIEGDDGGALATQLASTLCERYRCVDAARVTSSGALDFERARQLAVSGVLTGAVRPAGGKRVATLALLTRSPSPVRQWRFELEGPALAPVQLDALGRDLDALLRATTEPTPIPEGPPPAEVAVPVATSAAPAAKGEAFQRTEAVVVAEVGVDVTGRHLEFGGDSSAAPFGYDAGAFARPRLRLEAYPGALATRGPLAGLGAYADFSFSVGLETNPNTTPGATTLPNRPTTFRQLDAGLLWRFRPAAVPRLTLVPSLSYRQLRMKVDEPVPGLPDADLQGVEGALRAEIAVWRSVSVLAGVGYVRWVRARDLIGDADYYPSGSAHALDLELGVAIAVAGPLSVRVVGEYLSTSYALDADPPETPSSTSATDRYVGARAMLRFRY